MSDSDIQTDRAVPQRRKRHLWTTLSFSADVWSVLVLTFAVFASIGVLTVIMSLYLVALGFREDFVGFVSFASAIALTAAAIPAGWLSNRIGAVRCLVGGTSGLAIAGTIFAFTANPVTIVGAMILHSASQAFIFVPSTPYLMEISRKVDYPRVFAASFACVSVGGIVGRAIASFVPAIASAGAVSPPHQYRFALLVGAALAAFGTASMLVAVQRGRKPVIVAHNPASLPARAATEENTPSPGADDRRAVFLEITAMAITTALLNVPTAILTVFFNVFLHQRLGVSTPAVGLVYTIGAAVTLAMGLAGPAVGAKFNTVPVISASRLMSGLATLVPAVVPSVIGSGGSFVLRSGLVGLAQPIDTAFVMARVPRHLRAHASAVRNMSLDISWALTSVVAGYVVVRWGYRPIFVIGGLCAVASAVVFYLVFNNVPERPELADPGPPINLTGQTVTLTDD